MPTNRQVIAADMDRRLIGTENTLGHSHPAGLFCIESVEAIYRTLIEQLVRQISVAMGLDEAALSLIEDYWEADAGV